jgi:hypothetical protein
MRSYRDRDIKLLFAKSGGMCAFPDCKAMPIVRETDDIIGHIAHIVGHSQIGPRPDPTRPEEDRNSYKNLILLCPTHHAEVDSPAGVERWSSEALVSLKQVHEQWVASRLAIGEPVQINISQFYYLNIPRLAALAFLTGQDLDLSFIEGVPLLQGTGLEMTRALMQFERVLERIQLRAVPVESQHLLDNSIIGVTLTFEGTFRTRHVPSPHDIKTGRFSMHGDVARDPQIYRKLRDVRLILPLDPKWITSTTAFGRFMPSGGQGTFAGACTVAHIDFAARTVVATPLFIGIPRSPFDRFF